MREAISSSAPAMQTDKSSMTVLGVILARAGSKGLPDKCVRPLLGRRVIEYTFDHVESSRLLTASVFTTDSVPAANLARNRGIEVIERPTELAIDTATVDAAARHAVDTWESQNGRCVDFVVLLYGNIPVRAEGLIDRALAHLQETGADSVRSVVPVTKQHPDWVHRLDGDRMTQFRSNSIYRRQDLEPLYYHDGAVAAVTRKALFDALDTPTDFQSFLGKDRRAIVCGPEDAVDIDGPVDLALAEAILKHRMAAASTGTADHTMPQSRKTLLIGNRAIGSSESVFVIAEAGVNHNGALETALQMVDAAARAGADAVKFQVFRARELTSCHAATVTYQKQATRHSTQQAMLKELELSEEQLSSIKSRCDERNIIFLGTPFGTGDVDQLVRLGVPAIKIASSDVNNNPLLETAAATSLPLIVSTGAATADELRECVRFLDRCGAASRLVLLHCVSSYPAPIDSINLRAIAALCETFETVVGFSDHTVSLQTGGLATMAGACVVEKHFTLDQTMTGPDHAMSLSPDELAEYIDSVRQAECARGSGTLGYCPREQEVRDAARRSIVSDQPIALGTRITRAMLALKRPGTGIPPGELDRLIGRTASQNIPSDTLLSWDMVR